MIDPNAFTEKMEKHWTEGLGNVSSEALRKVWYQLAQVFGYYAIGDSKRENWTILQPPTGSGKTQGTIVYCSMLARLKEGQHPGVLIVTRLKADADQIAKRINELSENSDEAIAYHGDSKKRGININDLQDYPVLVITHRAYELALDLLGQEGKIQQTWPFFYNWKGANRRLVIIDEALDIVEHSQAALEGLRLTEAAITQPIRKMFHDEVQCINAVINILDTYEKRTKNKEKTKEHRILKSLIEEEVTCDFIGLRKAMRAGIRYDNQSGKSDNLEQQRLRELHDTRIRDLDNIVKSWVYYAHTEYQPTLNTARLLVPDNIQGAVVLDATASSNVLYKLFKPAEVIIPPPDSRNYKNVTLHISRGHKLGKRYMRNKAKELSRELIGELNERLGKDKKVFICTHKDVEPVLESFEPKFDLRTGHWGAVDGSNEYKDCDTAVIFGLPYRPNTWSANVFMALQEPQSSEWLQESSKRTWESHKDIRKSLKHGQIKTSIIQAINRVRCRRAIDAEGNCPETDVYLMLPNDGIADEILDGIKREMPGIKTEEWNFSSSKRKVKRSHRESALIKFIKNMDIGRQAMSKIKEFLGMPDTTAERMIKKMKDEKSELYKAMATAGAKYISQGLGKGKRAYIVKDWIEAQN
jgi:DEAD/DEAH box helicase